jgi:predicted nuclease of restriction endonuclease-like RecB superfamily
VIPDFTLRRGGAPVYVEILGFWRKASLTRRLETMRRHGPRNLIIAASRKLFQDADPEALPDGVVLFAEVIPVKEVLRMAVALLESPAPRARKKAAPTA